MLIKASARNITQCWKWLISRGRSTFLVAHIYMLGCIWSRNVFIDMSRYHIFTRLANEWTGFEVLFNVSHRVVKTQCQYVYSVVTTHALHTTTYLCFSTLSQSSFPCNRLADIAGTGRGHLQARLPYSALTLLEGNPTAHQSEQGQLCHKHSSG